MSAVTGIRLSKEHRDYLKKLSMENNGTPNISNGIRILIVNAIRNETKK